MDCIRKWIGNAVQRSPPARDEQCRVPEVDESTIQLPSLLLVVGAMSLQLVSSSLLKFAEMLLENDVAFITP